MGVSANVRILIAYRFLANLIPAYVIERLFWEQRGMTISLVVVTEIIYSVSALLFEIPSGVLADRIGRKPLLVVSAVMRWAEFALLLFAMKFWHFAVVVVLAGVGRAARSGAEHALLYDTLQQAGQSAAFEKRVGQLNACDFAAAIVAALSGSFLASRFDLSLNYWLSMGSALAALLLSLLLVEPAASGPSEQRRAVPVRQHLMTALRFFRSHPGVGAVVLSGMVTGVALTHVYEYWQLYVSRIGVPVAYFGAISTGFMLLQLPGNLLVHRLIKRFPARSLVATTTAVLALGLAVAAAHKSVCGLIALFVLCLGAGVVAPLVTGYIHHRTDSSIRGTVESMQSLGGEAAAALAGLGFGWFSARWDVFGGYGFLAVLCGAFFIWLVAGRRGRRPSRPTTEIVPR